MIIRTATTCDVPEILRIGRRLHDESEYGVLRFDPKKTRAAISFMVQDDNHGTFVAEDGHKLVGMICCECESPYFSSEKVAGEHMVYVVPESRGSVAFYRLVAMATEWAVSKGAKILYFRTSSGIEKEKVDNIYRRLDFNMVGGIYRRFL